MKIPGSFTLGGRKWKVILTDSIPHPDGDMLGECDPDSCTIYINQNKHDSDEYLELTFWHEFAHAVFFAEGHMQHDEPQIDRFGSYMYQSINTMKGVPKWQTSSERTADES